MKGKRIEVAVTRVDRDADPVQSATIGFLTFNDEDPLAPPEVSNPMDYRTLAVLKRWIDQVWDESKALAAEVEK